MAGGRQQSWVSGPRPLPTALESAHGQTRGNAADGGELEDPCGVGAARYWQDGGRPHLQMEGAQGAGSPGAADGSARS